MCNDAEERGRFAEPSPPTPLPAGEGSLGSGTSPRRADDARLRFDGDAEAILHRCGDPACQVEQFQAGRVAVVDQHQRVLGGDAGIAVAMALPAAGFDHPRGGQLAVVRGVAAEYRQRGIVDQQRVGLRDGQVQEVR